MTWTPGFQTNTVGVREAILLAIQTTLVNALGSLNTSLGAGGVAPILPGPPQLASGSIVLGDLDRLPDMGAYGPFWCQIVAGGERDARDVDAELQASPALFKYTFSTNVDFYLQPEAFSISDAVVQAGYRERWRARVTAWLMESVFNNSSTLSLVLASQTFAQPDTTQLTLIGEMAAGYVDRSFGGTVRVYHLHACIRSEMYGSVG